MTALEMLERLASVGYKACWYAWPMDASAPVHLRVTNLGGGDLGYIVNYKPATREQAQALLEENMTASLPAH